MTSRGRRVASPADLRTAAQGAKVGLDQRWTYVIFRRVSIYITWLFLHTSATPNQITVLSIVTAIAGLIVLALNAGTMFVVGLALLLLYHLLDRVDGEVARTRSHFSLIGIYLDNSGHHFTSAFVFISAGMAISSEQGLTLGTRVILMIGAIGAVAATNARVAKNAPFQLFSQYVMTDPTLVATVAPRSDPLSRQATKAARQTRRVQAQRSPTEAARDLILAFTQFTAILTALLVGWVVSALSDEIVALEMALAFCALLQVVGWLGAEAVNLRSNLGNEVHRLWRVDSD